MNELYAAFDAVRMHSRSSMQSSVGQAASKVRMEGGTGGIFR